MVRKSKIKKILKVSSIVLSIAVVAVVSTYTILKFTSGSTSVIGSDIEGQKIEQETTLPEKFNQRTDSYYESTDEETIAEEDKQEQSEPKPKKNSGFYGVNTGALSLKK